MDISAYQKAGKVKQFKKNEVVFMENDLGDNMYLILKGEVGIYVSTFTDFPMRIAVIPEGATFGEMSLIDGWPRSATVIAEKDCIALSIDKGNFTLLINNNPEIVERIAKMLVNRIETTTEMVKKSGKTVPPLPDTLKEYQYTGAEDARNLMILLAQRIRELNSLVAVEKEHAPQIKTDVHAVSILPKGHPKFDVLDQNDNSKLLAKKQYVCPYCGNGFMGRIPLFSRLKEKERTYDFRIVYDNFEMLRYTNVICPNCNFCDTYQEFTKRQIPYDTLKVEGNQFVNEEQFIGYADEIGHTVDETILSFYLQLVCLEQVPKSSGKKGKVYHKMHWFYSDLGEKELARGAARKAVSYYSEHIAEEGDSINSEEYITLNLIIAELYFSLEEYEKSIEYLSCNAKMTRLASHDIVKTSIKRIAELKYDYL